MDRDKKCYVVQIFFIKELERFKDLESIVFVSQCLKKKYIFQNNK